jgi:hypothetical protein
MNRFFLVILPLIFSTNLLAAKSLKAAIDLTQKVQNQLNCALSSCTSPRCPAFAQDSRPVKNSELKISIPCEDKNKLAALKLDDERTIHFLDNTKLELNKNGVLVRERDGELTVKLRPMNPELIDEDWYSFENFKCEDDATLQIEKDTKLVSKKSVISCSLTFTGSTLTDDQKRFIKKFKNIDYDKFENIKLGPIKSTKYKYKTIVDGFSKIDVEEWILGPLRNTDGTIKKPAFCFLEISSKVPFEESDKAIKLMYEHFKALGLDIDSTSQGNKSKKALEYFTQH